MSAHAPLPEVVGGWLMECVGGPLDGRWLYLPFGEMDVPVGHFNDPQRTPWLWVRRHAENYLGYYAPERYENGAQCRWKADYTADQWERVRRGEKP